MAGYPIFITGKILDTEILKNRVKEAREKYSFQQCSIEETYEKGFIYVKVNPFGDLTIFTGGEEEESIIVEQNIFEQGAGYYDLVFSFFMYIFQNVGDIRYEAIDEYMDGNFKFDEVQRKFDELLDVYLGSIYENKINVFGDSVTDKIVSENGTVITALGVWDAKEILKEYREKGVSFVRDKFFMMPNRGHDAVYGRNLALYSLWNDCTYEKDCKHADFIIDIFERIIDDGEAVAIPKEAYQELCRIKGKESRDVSQVEDLRYAGPCGFFRYPQRIHARDLSFIIPAGYKNITENMMTSEMAKQGRMLYYNTDENSAIKSIMIDSEPCYNETEVRDSDIHSGEEKGNKYRVFDIDSKPSMMIRTPRSIVTVSVHTKDFDKGVDVLKEISMTLDNHDMDFRMFDSYSLREMVGMGLHPEVLCYRYENADNETKGSRDAKLIYAQALSKLSDDSPVKSIEMLEDLLEENPNDETVIFVLGEIYFYSGWEEKQDHENAQSRAYELFLKYNELIPDSYDVSPYLARLTEPGALFADEVAYDKYINILKSDPDEYIKYKSWFERNNILSDSDIEALDFHVSKYFGEVSWYLGGIGSSHATLAVIPPGDKRPYHTIITRGFSYFKMNLPESEKPGTPQRMEFMIYLPKEWDVNDLSKWENSWSLRFLEKLGTFLTGSGRFVASGYNIDYGDKLDEGVDFTGVLIWEPSGYDDGAMICDLPSGERVAFYNIIPMYREETELKISDGLEGLFEKGFAKAGSVIDVKRKNYAADKGNSGILN